MPDTMMHEPSCPGCGGLLARTTLLWPDPDATTEIVVERPGLWCATCGSEVLEPLAAPATGRRRAA